MASSTERIGRAVLELTTDKSQYTAGLQAGQAELQTFSRQTQITYRNLTAGMSAAGREASASTKLLAGMNMAGRQAAEVQRAAAAASQTFGARLQGLAPPIQSVTTRMDAMTRGMSAAAKQSQASITMIGGMSKAGREAAAALSSVEKPASFLTTKMVAIGAAAGSFIGNIATNAVYQLSQGLLTAAANGAKFTAIEGSFQRLATGIGQSGAAMLMVSRTATKGLISDLDLMQSANKAMLLGLPVTAQEMGTLSKAAITLGRAMGLDATTSLDNLITALGRSSPLILDNLGLTVKVGEANESYARTLGKTASQLTQAEQKMAFYRAAMDAALKKTEELGEVQLGVVEQLSRLGVSTGNLVTTMAAGANESKTFAGFLGAIADQAEEAVRQIDLLAEARRNLANQGIGGPKGPTPAQIEEEVRRLERARSLLLAQTGTDAASPTLPTLPQIRPLGIPEAELKKLEEQGKALQQRWERLTELGNALFGRDVIARANDLVAALGSIGNVSKLSIEKQREVHEAVTAAIAVYERLGQVAPTRLREVAEATSELLVNTTKFTSAYTAMPAAIESAASSIEGRLLPALHGVASALENAAQRKAALDELMSQGMLAPDLSGVRNEDASSEARQIARARLEKQLQERRDQIAAFWKRQGASFAEASVGRLGSLFFGNIGHDITGELRAAADEAHQEFLKIQRTGKATAQELELAFKRWREAEDRANLTFGERWKQFWGGLKQTFVNTLNEMLQEFVGNFLKGLARGLASSGLGQKLGSLLGGGGGGGIGGGVVNTLATRGFSALATGGSAAAIPSGVLTNGVLTGVGAGGGVGPAPASMAGGGGSFLTNPAFWTNPWTIGIGLTAGILTWGITKKGWFRGGWEGIEGNKRRDQFWGQLQARYGGTQYEAAVKALAAAKVTGEPASRLINAIYKADGKKEFESAQVAFLSALERGGVKGMRAFRFGTPKLDFMNFGARRLAELHGREAVIPEGGGHQLAGEIVKGMRGFLPELWSRIVSPQMPTLPPLQIQMPKMEMPRLLMPEGITSAQPGRGPTHIIVEVNTTIEGARDLDIIRKEFHDTIIPEFKFALTHHTDGLVPAIKAVR